MDARIPDILRGYARANKFLEQERMDRLANLSQEESRAIFAELVEFGLSASNNNLTQDQLYHVRLKSIIAIRQTIATLAKAKGWI